MHPTKIVGHSISYRIASHRVLVVERRGGIKIRDSNARRNKAGGLSSFSSSNRIGTKKCGNRSRKREGERERRVTDLVTAFNRGTKIASNRIFGASEFVVYVS